MGRAPGAAVFRIVPSQYQRVPSAGQRKGAHAMSEERRQVLEMLAAGKVTVEQANQLLEALGAEHRPDTKEQVPARAHQRGRRAQRARPTDAFFSNLTPDQLVDLSDHG